MGFRMHRSIQLMPGVRLNMSKSGLGLSAGVKGFHVSQMPNGRTRRTVSIPGTGMSYVTTQGHTARRPAAPRPANRPDLHAAPPAPAVPNAPGWLASKDEKHLYKALQSTDVATIEHIADSDHDLALAATTIAGLLQLRAGNDDESLRLLAWVFGTGNDPDTDPFIEKYVSMQVDIEVVEGAEVFLAPSRASIGLALAELYQRANRSDDAIATVEHLEPTTIAALSLAELYCAAGRYDDVITTTEGCTNVDDATSLLWTFRGIAFREKKMFSAARDCFKHALSSTKRNPIVRHRALIERARCYEAEGKRALARKDLERIMAEDSTYDGLAEAMAELGS